MQSLIHLASIFYILDSGPSVLFFFFFFFFFVILRLDDPELLL